MIDLKNLKPIQISRDLKGKFVLLYGSPKIGKTTLASAFPKNLLLAFEPGYNALNDKMVQPITSWSEFKQVVAQLAMQEVKDKFDTVSIDTVDIAWDYCERFICIANPDKNGDIPKTLTDIPWGKGYDLCKKEYDSMFRQIAMLGYGIVFISHEQTKNLKNDKGEEYQKIMPTLADRPKLIVNRMVDIIAYLRQVTDENGNKIRNIYIRGGDNFEAGTRFRYMAPKFEMTYDNLVKELYEAIDKEAADNNQVPLETSENLFYKKSEDFNIIMEQCKTRWAELIAQDKEKYGKAMNDIIVKIFQKPFKLSDATIEQQELVEAVLAEFNSL